MILSPQQIARNLDFDAIFARLEEAEAYAAELSKLNAGLPIPEGFEIMDQVLRIVTATTSIRKTIAQIRLSSMLADDDPDLFRKTPSSHGPASTDDTEPEDDAADDDSDNASPGPAAMLLNQLNKLPRFQSLPSLPKIGPLTPLRSWNQSPNSSPKSTPSIESISSIKSIPSIMSINSNPSDPSDKSDTSDSFTLSNASSPFTQSPDDLIAEYFPQLLKKFPSPYIRTIPLHRLATYSINTAKRAARAVAKYFQNAIQAFAEKLNPETTGIETGSANPGSAGIPAGSFFNFPTPNLPPPHPPNTS